MLTILGISILIVIGLVIWIILLCKNNANWKKQNDILKEKRTSEYSEDMKHILSNIDDAHKKSIQEIKASKDQEIQNIINNFNNTKDSLTQQTILIEDNIESNKKILEQQEQEKQHYIEEGKKDIEQELEKIRLLKKNEIEKYYADQQKTIDEYRIKTFGDIESDFIEKKHKLEEDYKIIEQNISNKIIELDKNYAERKNKLDEEYKNILEELEDYRSRRATINEAILREKEIQEKENFYRIVVSQNDKEDIQILNDIAPRLRHKEVLNKLIYDTFIKRPLQEMEKRVLENKDFSGIYKITYINTGEAYIGKSTSIKTRWQNHVKTAFNLDGCAHTTLHTKMAECGIWNFTFEVLERVDKENLSERENYWINFYDTKNYGLNQKNGG